MASSTPSERVNGPNPKRRNRLSKEGDTLLNDFWKNHTSAKMPSTQERGILTEKIRSLPGCDWWRGINTRSWFQRRLSKANAADARFSSLTETSLNHLGVLIRDQPNPSSDVVKTWAELLVGARVQDVVDWVAYVQELTHDDNISAPASSLPTPPSTATPEPNPMVQPWEENSHEDHQIVKPDPALSPTVPVQNYSEQMTTLPMLRTVGQLLPSPSITPTSPICPAITNVTILDEATLEQNNPSQGSEIHTILSTFAEDPSKMTSNFPLSTLPTTADAFRTACNAHNIKLRSLLHLLQSDF